VEGWIRDVEDPSWIDSSPDGRSLYAVEELSPDGRVSALRSVAGRPPVRLNTVVTGAKPAHLAVHPSGRFLLTALFDGGGVAVHPLQPDGSVGPVSDQHRHVDPARVAHAHQVTFDPVAGDVLVVDLGTDSIHRYQLLLDTGRLVPTGRIRLATGSGPRHLAWHPSGSFAYVAGELDSTVTVCRRAGGTLVPGPVFSALPEGFPGDGPNYPGEILVSAGGRVVYLSNRGSNTISVFAVGADPADLTLLATPSCAGDWPRHLALDRTGRWLYCANERSGELRWFPLDPATGRPAAPAGRLAVPGIAQFRLESAVSTRC
jgi:6-phosphogluconolactonase